MITYQDIKKLKHDPRGFAFLMEDEDIEKVESYCKDGPVAEEVRRRLETYEGYPEIKDKVEVRILTELPLVKEMQGK